MKQHSVYVQLTMNIDTDLHLMSVDDEVEADIEDVIREMIYDIDGFEIKELTVRKLH